MNEHDILQSFRHSNNGTWTPLKEVAVTGVRMEPGIVFLRGEPFSGSKGSDIAIEELIVFRP